MIGHMSPSMQSASVHQLRSSLSLVVPSDSEADCQRPGRVIGQLVSALGRLPVKAAVVVAAIFGLAALWASPAPAATGVRDVVFVGNNWDGTADVIDPHRNFKRVARINIIPDIQPPTPTRRCR